MDDRYYGFVLIDECDSVLTYEELREKGIAVRAESLENAYQMGLHGVNGLFLSSTCKFGSDWLEYNNLVLMNVVVPKFLDGRLISEPEAELWMEVGEDEPSSDWYTYPVSERGWTKVSLDCPANNPVDIRGKISATLCLSTIYHDAPPQAKPLPPKKAAPAKAAPAVEESKTSQAPSVELGEVERQRAIYKSMFSFF